MTALQGRKGTWGRKRTAASVVAGICRGIIERRMRYLVYSGVLAAALCHPAGPAAAACDQFTPFGQPVLPATCWKMSVSLPRRTGS